MKKKLDTSVQVERFRFAPFFYQEEDMKISIRKTVASEAQILSQIQKAAFLPLYEKYHDEGNPCLRGKEDILRRLNPYNHYFTILCNDEIVGGIFYRCAGTRPPAIKIEKGEYYLCRIYVHPDYQGRGIASKAILLCEREFSDAKVFYVDFPRDLEKNRRCYEKAGYKDTGEIIVVEGAPVLAMYKKIVG